MFLYESPKTWHYFQRLILTYPGPCENFGAAVLSHGLHGARGLACLNVTKEN